MAIRQAVLVLCVRSRAAPALGTWMRSSPEIPPLFIKKVNPRWLISVFLKRVTLFFSIFIHFLKIHVALQHGTISVQHHPYFDHSLLSLLRSYSSKVSWDHRMVGWRDGILETKCGATGLLCLHSNGSRAPWLCMD